MTNPWLKSNPYMSLWLSAANSAMGRQRGAAMAELNRQQAEFARQSMAVWAGAWKAWLPSRDRG